ncbi:hypothetical protein RFW15_13295 [Enterococcus faecalis]|jgi:hypothetical protein|uniref:hypothetical protein n=1 Tax=Enterococcus faecalis TaxID=1351 RepID=UPI0019261273|nr:hypothetical protein [Enterococcus faecalis]MDR0028420.1 hypothetical protein [Enterococcus faecalis]
MVGRTKKGFKPYNDYVDRPFELKRPTSFPLGELQAAIKETNIIIQEKLNVYLSSHWHK